MPGRGEFETDYGNELDEICVKELSFEETDSQEDIGTNFQVAQLP
jgi:transcriptional adapter 2-alpha